VNLRELEIVGAYVATHRVYPDERGLFREWFKAEAISRIDANFSVRQANYSKSRKSVIRGIHYSVSPEGQSKIVTCVNGLVTDVLVDLRVGSPTFLRVEYISLSDESGDVLYIPTGVGHGFIVESSSASVAYLASSTYAPTYEKAICPTDPSLGIRWPLESGQSGIISQTDRSAPSFLQVQSSGNLPIFTTK
jgi:dTDP-4-dehydrorhamnose 3,5-epimerase